MKDTSAAVSLHGESASLVFLLMVWAAMCVLADPSGNFPLNDDWVYALAVRSILATGHFALPSPASANVILQAYWGALFCLPSGFSFTALRLSTLLAAAAGVLALFLLLRELGAPRVTAIVGALTLAVNPIYFELSASFMTDVPFTALFTISLWLYVRGAAREHFGLIAAAILLALAATAVRQFGLILLLGFAAAHIARNGHGIRSLASAVLPFAFGIALQLGYDHWLIAAHVTPKIPEPLHQLFPFAFNVLASDLTQIIWIFMPYLGLFIAPFIGTLAPRRGALLRNAPVFWMSVALLFLVAVERSFTIGAVLPVLGNVLLISGLGPLTLRDTFLLNLNQPPVPVYVVWMWVLGTVPCLAAASYLVIATWREIRQTAGRPLPWQFILMVAVAGAYVAAVLLISHPGPFFDRYFLPLVPPLIAILVLLQRNPSQLSARQLSPCLLLLCLYAAFTIPAAHDYLAWNRARWQATSRLQQAGITPRQIDGGYEFNGWYLHDANYRKTPDKSYWWVADDTYVIASGPLPGYRQIGSVSFSRWLPPERSDIIILRRLTPHPPAQSPHPPAP
jgi:hypothetical protein